MDKSLGHRIWIFTALIMAIGLMALYSASYQNFRVAQETFYDQLIMALLSLGVMFVLNRIDYRRFYDAAYVLYAINILLLIVVFVAGRHALGARRWIELGGLSFQPSEITKLAVILMLGRYFSEARPKWSFSFINNLQVFSRDLAVPFFWTAVSMLLIFKQPDLGTAILIFGIFFVILFASGIEYRYVLGFVGVCLAAVPFAWNILKPYQKDRLLVFLNPNIDPLGAGYTIIQSKIAIGSGQLFGKGWLAGTQNQLNFLPERHTDFIFSVVGEEWGLLGTLALVFCFFALIHSGLKIAEQVKDRFGVLVTVGIVSILALQVIVNVGMVMGMFPVVGLTLPFVSYGRTSFLTFAVMMGFLLNLSKHRTIFS